MGRKADHREANLRIYRQSEDVTWGRKADHREGSRGGEADEVAEEVQQRRGQQRRYQRW